MIKTRIIFWLTSRCNLNCKNCAYGVGRTAPSFEATWDYVEQAAQFFRGIEHIQISGGEPMLHPQFSEWSLKFKDLFQCRELAIETNAILAMQHERALRCYDAIKATRYHPDVNGMQIDWLLSKFPEKVVTSAEPANHTSIDLRPGLVPCGRGTMETAAYCNGLIYRCCIGPGPEGAVGIQPSERWQDELKYVKLPCQNCWFAIP